ncbi:MAG: hypothetical protein AAB519_01175 [Patescibacteria group bacterium]
MVAIVLLILNWRKNVVWGAFTLGIVIALISSVFVGFDWIFIAKGGIVGAFLGQILNFIPTDNNVS